MDWVVHLHNPPHSAPPSTPPVGSWSGSSRGVTPTLLIIIVILTVVFLLSALLHLLVRFLASVADTRRVDDDNVGGSVTALHGQLLQLFHLHDAGLDQSFINDNLPLFTYKAIIGVRDDQFDCAICLCGFEKEDQLRLIPSCSHAFHVECIDTWLLSHSTCPLCRANLLHDGFSSKGGHRHGSSPVVVSVILESGSETTGELGPDPQPMRFEIPTTSGGVVTKDEGSREEKVVAVKLGKFRNLEDGEASSFSFDSGGTNIVDGRKCFSMGSFAYVMDETSALRVPIRTPVGKRQHKKPPLPLPNGRSHHLCNCESMREFSYLERSDQEINSCNPKSTMVDEASNQGTRKESISESKTWQRDKKERPAADSLRRAFSFRFPDRRSQEGERDEDRGTLQGEGEESVLDHR
ncbi:hypothetical protein MLD38_006058 [Melastoma candidum]|uniref:Uncharacterized protein n=1 Tax=Melastoma candidum TaxID=119954 RepID=A0ACB9RLB4_9MYRT|nr:hypothetical protein MLD38_006058 [Melastoma candidum]